MPLILPETLTAVNAASGQGKIAFVRAATISSPSNQLWVMNDDGSSAHQILTMPGVIQNLRWSRDGSRIAFVSTDQLWVVNEDGSNRLLLNPHVAGGGLSWDAAGTGLIYSAFCTCCEYMRAVNLDGTNDRVWFNGRIGFVMTDFDARPNDANPDGLVAYRLGSCSENALEFQFFGVELTRSGVHAQHRGNGRFRCVSLPG